MSDSRFLIFLQMRAKQYSHGAFECFRRPVETIGAMVRYWELVTRNLFRLLFFNEYMRIPYVRICHIFQNRQIDQQACRLLAKSFPSKATTVFVRYSIAIVKN